MTFSPFQGSFMPTGNRLKHINVAMRFNSIKYLWHVIFKLRLVFRQPSAGKTNMERKTFEYFQNSHFFWTKMSNFFKKKLSFFNGSPEIIGSNGISLYTFFFNFDEIQKKMRKKLKKNTVESTIYSKVWSKTVNTMTTFCICLIYCHFTSYISVSRDISKNWKKNGWNEMWNQKWKVIFFAEYFNFPELLLKFNQYRQTVFFAMCDFDLFFSIIHLIHQIKWNVVFHIFQFIYAFLSVIALNCVFQFPIMFEALFSLSIFSML